MTPHRASLLERAACAVNDPHIGGAVAFVLHAIIAAACVWRLAAGAPIGP
jgi:hypothetical protein